MLLTMEIEDVDVQLIDIVNRSREKIRMEVFSQRLTQLGDFGRIF
jgi:hypothetical protein